MSDTIQIRGVTYRSVPAIFCERCTGCSFDDDWVQCEEAREQVDCSDGDIIWVKTEGETPQHKGSDDEDIRSYNIGTSDYAKHKIQPWDIWLEYNLNPWDADIVKRVLRQKEGDSRRTDYEKIIHICKERMRQLDSGLK